MQIKKKIFFYCQTPIDYFYSYCLTDYFKKNYTEKNYLIYSKNDYSINYDWSHFLSNFKKKYQLPQVKIGGLKNRINIKGLIFFLFFGIPRLLNFIIKLKKIDIPTDSLIITFGGVSIEKSILLAKNLYNKEVKTFLIGDNFNHALLKDFRYAFYESLYYNFYQFLIAKKYISIYWFLDKNTKTSQREVFFDKRPSDLFYQGEYYMRNRDVNILNDKIYWPTLQKRHVYHDYKKYDEILLIGGMFHWEKLINLKEFYKKYNHILKFIKKNHIGKKLTYIIHPSELFERKFELANLNIDGFKIVDGESAEHYILRNDKKKIIVFCIVSTTFYTLNQINIPCFNLFQLFNDNEIKKKLKDRYSKKWSIFSKDQKNLIIKNFNDFNKVLKGFDYPKKNYYKEILSVNNSIFSKIIN